MRYTTLFIDLDDTLYPSSTGLWEAIRARMSQYMVERLGLPSDMVPEIRRYYYLTYGTTLRGLQKHYQVNSDDYLAYVHDLPLEKYIQPSLSLKNMLVALPQVKWIFTNADHNHANRVLEIMDISNCFQGIIDVNALGYLCKPELEAYLQAMKLAGVHSASNCVLCDDAIHNLLPARQLGFTTVLVGTKDGHSEVHFTVPRLEDLPQVMPELFSATDATRHKR